MHAKRITGLMLLTQIIAIVLFVILWQTQPAVLFTQVGEQLDQWMQMAGLMPLQAFGPDTGLVISIFIALVVEFILVVLVMIYATFSMRSSSGSSSGSQEAVQRTHGNRYR